MRQAGTDLRDVGDRCLIINLAPSVSEKYDTGRVDEHREVEFEDSPAVTLGASLVWG
jgi:hypothetical protein